MELSDIRKKIDGIDEEIITLLAARMECSLAVREWKKNNDAVVFDPTREQQMMERFATLSSDELTLDDIQRVYGEILDISREKQSAE